MRRFTGHRSDVVEPYEKLVAQNVARHGNDHPETIIPRSNLGRAYNSLGRHEQALEHLEIALASSRRAMPGHWLEAAHLGRYGERRIDVVFCELNFKPRHPRRSRASHVIELFWEFRYRLFDFYNIARPEEIKGLGWLDAVFLPLDLHSAIRGSFDAQSV